MKSNNKIQVTDQIKKKLMGHIILTQRTKLETTLIIYLQYKTKQIQDFL